MKKSSKKMWLILAVSLLFIAVGSALAVGPIVIRNICLLYEKELTMYQLGITEGINNAVTAEKDGVKTKVPQENVYTICKALINNNKNFQVFKPKITDFPSIKLYFGDIFTIRIVSKAPDKDYIYYKYGQNAEICLLAEKYDIYDRVYALAYPED